jgi:hypothetical protein
MTTNELSARFLLLMTGYWQELVDRLHAQALDYSGSPQGGPIIDDAMLNVATSQVAIARGPRAAAILLRQLAANLDGAAETIDGAMPVASAPSGQSQSRH